MANATGNNLEFFISKEHIKNVSTVRSGIWLSATGTKTDAPAQRLTIQAPASKQGLPACFINSFFTRRLKRKYVEAMDGSV